MTAQDGAPETLLEIYKMKISPHSPQVNCKYQLVSKIAALGQISPKCRADTQKKFPLKELCHGIFIHFADVKKLFSH